jgi:cytoskeletal protein RodZ
MENQNLEQKNISEEKDSLTHETSEEKNHQQANNQPNSLSEISTDSENEKKISWKVLIPIILVFVVILIIMWLAL